MAQKSTGTVKKIREKWVFCTLEQIFLIKNDKMIFIKKSFSPKNWNHFINLSSEQTKKSFYQIIILSLLKIWNDANHFIMIKWFYDENQIKW